MNADDRFEWPAVSGWTSLTVFIEGAGLVSGNQRIANKLPISQASPSIQGIQAFDDIIQALKGTATISDSSKLADKMK